MTVGELVYALAAENPDATMQILDSKHTLEFTAACVIRDRTRNLVAIDLTHKECHTVPDHSGEVPNG